jgi:serine/threonine-protein kinase
MSEDLERVTAATAAVSAQRSFGPAPGTILFDKYRVESLLGLGATGVVVKAIEVASGEPVALKLLRDDVDIDDDTRLRLMREAGAAVRLRSRHAAKVRDVGNDDGQPFMVMELLEGMDLGRLLHANHRLDRTFAVELAFQACDALAEAHGIGIIHRDIKPSNLFVTWQTDGNICAKVLDFGISKTPQSEMLITSRASVLGTPAYMSPEQMRSAAHVDVRTDVWSLGAVLYEMVEGHPPFQAHTYAEMCVLVTTEPVPAMQEAPELTPIIERCLAKEPTERYQTIAELALALAPLTRDPTGSRQRVPKLYRLAGKRAPFVSNELAAVEPPDAPRPSPMPSGSQHAAPPIAIAPVTSPLSPRASSVMTVAIVMLVLLAAGLAIAINMGLIE